LKTVFGVAIIAFGIFLELLWLSVCFGTVIIGILLLIFAPGILFFPFNFFLTIGLIVMGKKPKINSSSFRYEKHYYNQNNDHNYSDYRQNSSYRNTNDNLDKYYEILESNKNDSFAVIKNNYRRLMKEYHYDSIASKNLPPDMVKFAEEKTKSLNEAYSIIKDIKK